MSVTTIPALSFHGGSYTVLEDLVNDMAAQWAEGKQLLFDGTLRSHIRKSAPSIANSCATAEKEYSLNPNEGSQIFLKWLCRFPGIRGLYWQGKNYGDYKAIGTALQGLPDETLNKVLLFMLQSQLMSVFVKNVGAKDDLIENIKFLERCFNKTGSKFNRMNSLSMLEVFLNGTRTFSFDGHVFKTPAELAGHLQKSADISKSALSRKIQPLFQDSYNFDPYFEAWIVMHGFHHELTLWKGRFQEGQGDTDVLDFFLDEDEEEIREAREQSDSDFAKSVDGFEDKFIELLSNYSDRLDDPTAFNALISDYFPMNKLQAFLIMSLYRMDIMKAIRSSTELNEIVTARFEKRLVNDFGVKDSFAKWAVYEWCYIYGKEVLGKKASLQPVHL